ncbi:hypothetical protein DPMN_183537 [Dreissena polymorpha]|uniref:Uncharacterized protein n=1 Tax=Dreissena polymorpha TaxID=45954 RepID=A0A9D4DJ59_DREPO|nr:hypothetical protein DPMN_183537 [Dreissena polymorpha]
MVLGKERGRDARDGGRKSGRERREGGNEGEDSRERGSQKYGEQFLEKVTFTGEYGGRES